MREAKWNTARLTVDEALRCVPDPRKRRGRCYRWVTLLMVICAPPPPWRGAT